MKNNLIIYLVSVFIISGCAELKSSVAPQPKTYSLDGVKSISSNQPDGTDPSTMLQTSYSVSSQSRILLRLEDLLSKVTSVSLASGNTINVDVFVNNTSDGPAAQTAFSLCPLTKNWMMLATWFKAYPMGSTGIWQASGGDFDSSGCMKPVTLSGTQVTFDVKTWFVNYVQGRGVNNGLVLISSSTSPLVVRGDSDPAYSPRIRWIQ